MSTATIIAAGSGGFFGAVARLYLVGFVNRHLPHTLPFGTLLVNITGSFLLGIVFGLLYLSGGLSAHMKTFIATGFLGAMTTYSTFAMESFFLFQGGSYLLLAVNVALSVFGTIAAAGTGYLLITKVFA
ncbi:MAG: fluoride efflux transporter FluC [Campylobacterota bacterium]